MEAVKNRLTSLGRYARTLGIDPDQHPISDAGYRDLDKTVGGREAYCIIEDCIQRSRKPVGLAHDRRGFLARTGKGDPCAAGLAPIAPALGQLLDEGAEVDGPEMSAGKLGIGARR